MIALLSYPAAIPNRRLASLVPRSIGGSGARVRGWKRGMGHRTVGHRSIGGIIAGQCMGVLVDRWHNYLPVFVTAACLHPIAGLIVLFGLNGVSTVSTPGRERDVRI